jgi:hypothetical protein
MMILNWNFPDLYKTQVEQEDVEIPKSLKTRRNKNKKNINKGARKFLGLLGFYGFDFKSIKSFLFLILSSFVECRGFSTLNLNLLDFYLKEIYFKFLSQFLIQRFFFNIYYNLLFYIITSYIVCYCKMKLFEA